MSIVAISYHDLNQTARKANQVAQKLDSYASGINSKIINKLNNYQGGYSSDIASAINTAKQKVEILEEQAERQRAFANDLYALEEQCKAVDRAVKSKISNLTASFRDAYNIKIGTIDRVYSTVVSVFNSNVVTRVLKDQILAPVANWENALIGNIKHWFNYQGGKHYLGGSFWAGVEGIIGAIVFCASASIIVPTATTFAIVAGFSGAFVGAITMLNALKNAENEDAALKIAKGDDYPNPAVRAYRLHQQNSWQDTLRATGRPEDKRDAAIIDITVAIGTVVSVAYAGGQIVKKGFQWLMGSGKALSKITWAEVFSKQTGARLASKAKDTIKNTCLAIRGKDIEYFKQPLDTVIENFGKNIKNEYFNFGSTMDGAKSAKSLLKLAKDVKKEGVNKRLIIKAFVLPGLPLIPYKDDDVTFDDVFELIEKIKEKVLPVLTPSGEH